jgi:gas vesicle protein
MSSRDSGTIYFIAGLLMGGLVGAGIGMILAPETGEVTREKVRKAGNKLIKQSMDALETINTSDISPAMEKIADQVKTGAKEIRKNITTRIKTA